MTNLMELNQPILVLMENNQPVNWAALSKGPEAEVWRAYAPDRRSVVVVEEAT